MSVEARCETCGRGTQLPVVCCGKCAEDLNTPGGRERVNRRRRENGLKPLEASKS